MPYRLDLEKAHERISELELELEELKKKKVPRKSGYRIDIGPTPPLVLIAALALIAGIFIGRIIEMESLPDRVAKNPNPHTVTSKELSTEEMIRYMEGRGYWERGYVETKILLFQAYQLRELERIRKSLSTPITPPQETRASEAAPRPPTSGVIPAEG